jgi:hypothetical protein
LRWLCVLDSVYVLCYGYWLALCCTILAPLKWNLFDNSVWYFWCVVEFS